MGVLGKIFSSECSEPEDETQSTARAMRLLDNRSMTMYLEPQKELCITV